MLKEYTFIMNNFQNLDFQPLNTGTKNLVSPTVYELAQKLDENSRPLVAEINPQFTGSTEFCEHYKITPEDGANCIVIEIIKGEDRNIASCLVPIGYRADLNSKVRKHFGARRVSFAPLEEVEKNTHMEYGSITVFGLPNEWKILIDSKIMEREKIIIGGGKKISKLLISTQVLKNLPNVEIIDELSNKVTKE